jgi:glycosyltransferase involved in cell wall biosynthesis
VTDVVVHYCDGEAFGGTERAVARLIAERDRDRWRHVLLHHPAPGLAPLLDEARALGAHVIAAPRPGGIAAPRDWVRLSLLLRELDARVVHAHLTWPLACRHGLIAARLARVPAIVATAQLWVDLPGRPGIAAEIRAMRAIVHRYIAVSRHVADRLATRFALAPERIEVIHNAAPGANGAGDSSGGRGRVRDGVRAALGVGAGPLVVTLARLDPQKGLEHLIDAAALVPGATFVVAGEGSQRGALERRIAERGVGDRLRLLGSRRDVADLLAAADVFVLPSLFEGLPLSVLEAMAAGTPVVATAIGGTDEAVVHGETGLLVPPADPPALAAAVQRLLSDADLARRLTSAARERVERSFSPAAMARRVEQVYERVLRGRGRRGRSDTTGVGRDAA